jgi:hypothetical protein
MMPELHCNSADELAGRRQSTPQRVREFRSHVCLRPARYGKGTRPAWGTPTAPPGGRRSTPAPEGLSDPATDFGAERRHSTSAMHPGQALNPHTLRQLRELRIAGHQHST